MQKVLVGLKGENAKGEEITFKHLLTHEKIASKKIALIVVFHRNSRHLGKVWATKIHSALGSQVEVIKVIALKTMMSNFFKSGVESLLKEASTSEGDKNCVAVYGNDAKKLFKTLGATKEDGVVVALLSEEKDPIFVHEGGYEESLLKKINAAMSAHTAKKVI